MVGRHRCCLPIQQDTNFDEFFAFEKDDLVNGAVLFFSVETLLFWNALTRQRSCLRRHVRPPEPHPKARRNPDVFERPIAQYSAVSDTIER